MQAMRSNSVAAAVSSATIGLTLPTTAFVNVSACAPVARNSGAARFELARYSSRAAASELVRARRPTTNTDVYDRQPPTIGIQTFVFAG